LANDPKERGVEIRWNTALERVAHLEDRIGWHDLAAALRPKVDRAALMALASDMPATWNAPGTDARTKQRITHILIREVVLDRDDTTNEALVTIHWNGGRQTELRVSRVGTGRYPGDRHPSPMEAIRKLGGSRAGRDYEPDAVQTRRRKRVDHRSGARASRAARDRRFRSDATAH